MQDKSWLLKPAAINAAKGCIRIVQDELDVRLPLTHPDFLQMLNDYAELAGSAALNEAGATLNTFARSEQVVEAKRSAVVNLRDPLRTDNASLMRTQIIPPPAPAPAPAPSPQPVAPTAAVAETGGEFVNFNGRAYPKFLDGKKFAGLYRGQPRYM